MSGHRSTRWICPLKANNRHRLVPMLLIALSIGCDLQLGPSRLRRRRRRSSFEKFTQIGLVLFRQAARTGAMVLIEEGGG
jgi:hypothetical protein